MAAIPLISHRHPEDPVAWNSAGAVPAARFLAEVAQVAQQLPQRRYLVNFCTDRYRFAVGLAAALVRGQVSLLPPSRTPEMLRQLQEEYGQLYALVDSPDDCHDLDRVMFPPAADVPAVPFAVPEFPEEQVAAIAFTSGSTGRPAPQRKTWGGLARGASGEAVSLGLHQGARATLVGTVPPQHMYGLESTVLMALRNGLALHSGRPFYPADVRAALADITGDRVLVTTPVHLRALLAEETGLPELRLIVCATALLSPEMAQQAEKRFGAPLQEVYGFTEAGMVATRRTVEGPAWHCLPEVRVREDAGTFRVKGGHVENDVPFTDFIEMRDAQTFVLHGRSADLVNVAGKRTSLAYLNHHLNSIEGVNDGVFFMPDEIGGGVTRLTALVVAPGLAREDLLGALRLRIDAAFLPRPLYFVDALPRNATGKLPLDELVRLAQSCADGKRPGAVTVRRHFAASHPAADGHFPGNPVIPGAVLLDEIIDAATERFQFSVSTCTVKSAKFLRAVRPGEELQIRFEQQARGEIRFECRVDKSVAVTGSLLPGPGRREAA